MKSSGDGWETYKVVTNAMGIWQAKQKIKSVPHYYSPARGPTFLKLAQGRFSFIVFIKMLVKCCIVMSHFKVRLAIGEHHCSNFAPG